jgi:pesticin/yersiniabactin receptor
MADTQAEAMPSTEQDAQPTQLPAVTINATKRETSLNLINGAATILTKSQLDSAVVTSTADLPRLLPELQIQASGSLLFPAITLRGVTSAQDFYNPALTVYVDGVPQLPVMAWQTLLGVQQVELLKGPQGTLYGKSAQGGVLGIISEPPVQETRVQLKAGVSSDHGHLVQGRLAGALVSDLLYGALSVADTDAPGDLRNPVTGSDRQGGARSRTGKASLRLAPRGAPWELGVTAGRDCTHAEQDVYVPFDQPKSSTVYVMDGMPAQYADPSMRRCANEQSATGRYRFGDWRLSAMAAHQSVDIERRFALGPYDSQQPEQWQQNVQEIRVASQGEARLWDGVFGLYRQALEQDRHYINDLPSYGLRALDTRSNNRSTATAAYGDVTWHASPALDLGAGLRLSHDAANTQFAGSSLNYATYAADPFAGTGHTSETKWLGRINAGYRLSKEWRTYGSISQGYKPGGFNLAPSSLADASAFRDESSVSYEMGARYTTSTLQGSAALFRVDTQHAQLYRGDASTGTQNLRNVGDTRSQGAEVALQWAALPSWKLGLAAQVTNAKFRSYDDPVYCANCDGNTVPYVPRYGVSATIEGQLHTGTGQWRPRLALRRVGAQYFDTANTLRQNAFTVADAALSWQPQAAIELAIYVHNLTDRRYRTYAFSNSAMGNFAQVAPGRVSGVTLSYEY